MKKDYLKQNILSKFPNIHTTLMKEKDDEGNQFDFNFLAESMEGMFDGFGKHAGGVISIGNKADINLISPLCYPGNDPTSQLCVMHEYHMIEANLLKFDILGHTVPTTLKQLKELTNIDYNDREIVNISDEFLYDCLNDITLVGKDEDEKIRLKQNPLKTCSNGLPELSTKFLSGMIQQLKPKAFSDIVAIEGLSHGTNLWAGTQQDSLRNGLVQKEELISTREGLTKTLSSKGLDEAIAFKLVEKIRKGKKLLQEEINIIEGLGLKKEIVKNILKIGYLFPEPHAVAYGINAMQILWYKVYQPTAFYSVMLTQYASDVNDFDYQEVMNCDSLEELKIVEKKYEIGQNQKVVVKFKTRLADLLFEAKLRGYVIKKPNLYSHPNMFIPNPKNEKELMMPLSSMNGVALLTATKIYNSLSEKPYESYQELISRKDENGRAIFNKTTLEALNLYQLEDWEIESFDYEMKSYKE